MSTSLTAETVWQVLVEECGAPDDADAFSQFEHAWPCHEFRFCGALGFGGKVRGRYARPFGETDLFASVDCYPEDLTPERIEMIAKANARLLPQGEPE